MEVIRLQREIPEVYTDESRDFQLLCRVYDCVINSTKFDVDSIKKISSTRDIRTSLLPLLQTKIGFFSNSEFNDETLRTILEAFPLIMKKKGSLQSIKEILNVYLKILDLRIPVVVTKTEEETQLYNITIPEHTIVIGLNTSFQNTSNLFRDLLSYVMPAGFGYYVYFYSSLSQLTTLIDNNNVAIIYISDDINSLVRGESDSYTGVDNRLIGNVSLMEVMGSYPIASTVSAMSDTSKIYLYTGTESGYISNRLYHYEDSSWVLYTKETEIWNDDNQS